MQAKCSLLLLVAGLTITNATKHLQVSLRNRPEESKEASKCIETLTKRYLKNAYDITILSNEPMDWIFRIFDNFVKVLANGQQSDPPSFLELRKNALVILQGEDLEVDLAVLKNLKKFYPRASHLIHIANDKFDDRSWSNYLKTVAEYLTNINRTAIITMNDAKKQARVYGYSNYSYGNCGQMSIVNYGQCENQETLKRLFPKRLNLNGCAIKLSMIIVPPFAELYVEDGKVKAKGLESDLMILVMKQLNATVRVLRDLKSTQEIEHVTSSFTLRETIARGEADVGFGFFLQRHSEQAVYTRSYIFEYTSIIMSKSEERTLWINIVLPFQWQVWIFLISTIFLAVILTMTVPILHREFPTIHIIRGLSGTGLPKKIRRTSRKIYFLSWSMFGYVIMQSYLASLTGLLTKPNQPLEFQTLTQLEKSNYPVAGILTFKEHLHETNPGLYERYEVMDIATYFEVLQDIIAGRKKLAVHADQIHIRMDICGKSIKHHVIPERLEFHPTAALMPNTSVILEACDKIIIRILEAGLLEFWQTLVERRARVKCASHVATNATNSSEEFAQHAKISLVHLSGILLIFAIATSLSFLTFLCELFVAADRKKFGATVQLK